MIKIRMPDILSAYRSGSMISSLLVKMTVGVVIIYCATFPVFTGFYHAACNADAVL